eukprot:m51a1_g13470 hypothetical protein (100) ;mRNA; f:1858-2157
MLEPVDSVSILCISEEGWTDTAALAADLDRDRSNQYAALSGDRRYPPYARGPSALVTYSAPGAAPVSFLFDFGWGLDHVRARLDALGHPERRAAWSALR